MSGPHLPSPNRAGKFALSLVNPFVCTQHVSYGVRDALSLRVEPALHLAQRRDFFTKEELDESAEGLPCDISRLNLRILPLPPTSPTFKHHVVQAPDVETRLL